MHLAAKTITKQTAGKCLISVAEAQQRMKKQHCLWLHVCVCERIPESNMKNYLQKNPVSTLKPVKCSFPPNENVLIIFSSWSLLIGK